MVEGGSILHADHPRKWVIFARRFTYIGAQTGLQEATRRTCLLSVAQLRKKLVHHVLFGGKAQNSARTRVDRTKSANSFFYYHLL